MGKREPKYTLIGAYEEFLDKQSKERKMSESKATAATETNKILEAIEEHVWFDMPEEEKTDIKKQRIKSGEAIYILTKIFVEKGLLSFDDVVKYLRNIK